MPLTGTRTTVGGLPDIEGSKSVTLFLNEEKKEKPKTEKKKKTEKKIPEKKDAIPEKIVKTEKAEEVQETASESPAGGATLGKKNYLIEFSSQRRLVRHVLPVYPQSAREQKRDGSCKIKFWVNSSGIVSRALLLKMSGDSAIDSACLDAVRKWLFTPSLSMTSETGIVEFFFEFTQ